METSKITVFEYGDHWWMKRGVIIKVNKTLFRILDVDRCTLTVEKIGLLSRMLYHVKMFFLDIWKDVRQLASDLVYRFNSNKGE